MIDIILRGKLVYSGDDPNLFLNNFNRFLENEQTVFKGQIHVNQFEEAEIVEDTIDD